MEYLVNKDLLKFIKTEEDQAKVDDQHQITWNSENISYRVEPHVEYLEDMIAEDNICTRCFLSFVDAQSLAEHTLKSHASFSCLICKKLFKTQKTLNKHSKLHILPDKSQGCDETLEKRTATKKNMKEHLKTRFICKICSYVGASKTDLYYHHISGHTTKLKPLKFIRCDECTMAFREKEAFDAHKSYHRRAAD